MITANKISAKAGIQVEVDGAKFPYLQGSFIHKSWLDARLHGHDELSHSLSREREMTEFPDED